MKDMKSSIREPANLSVRIVFRSKGILTFWSENASLFRASWHLGHSIISGVGNRQSIAGRTDCMILLAGHIYSQFESIAVKIHNITSQIY